MIFSVLVIALILGVTYMHYLQGAFTAAISLACAVAAALVAFGYYESLVNMMGQSGFADYAGAVSLLVLFAITYGVLRVIADAVVPGNIQLQLYAEKTLAVVLGFAAAAVAGGTFAVATQLMPLGPAVAGYARYDVQDRDVVVPASVIGRQRGADTSIAGEVVKPIAESEPNALLLPVDNFVLSLVKMTSAGALSGDQQFGAIHPDLPTEAFNARLGADGGAKHAVLNTSKGENAKLIGLYTPRTTPRGLDTEISDLRPQKASLTYKPGQNEQVVIARVKLEPAAADKDQNIRITPAAARLVIGDQTYYPFGTMESAGLVGLTRIDDEILVPLAGSSGVDLAYVLPKSVAESLAKPATGGEPRFLEIKLFGRIDLQDKTTEPYKADKTYKVLRKKESPLGKELNPTPQG